VSRSAALDPRPAELLPEPGRCWIRYAPRAWDVPDRPWVDLAAGTVGAWERGAPPRSPELPPAGEDARADDVFYLPPVTARRGAARDRLAASLLVGGTPVVVQLFPGEETSIPAVQGVAFVFDLLTCLVDRELGSLRRLRKGACAVWPLIAGLTDDPALWELGCRDLAAAGVAQALGLAVSLSPRDRRRLAERRGDEESTFDALFHHPAPAERDFASAAARHGLAPFLPRPLPRPPLLGAGNRRLAGVLASIGDLWLRLGRPSEPGHAFFRDARWIDGGGYDVEALAREGNLGVLPLEASSRAALVEVVATGESSLLEELRQEYLDPARRVTPDAPEERSLPLRDGDHG
jgi:hypothetical protein